MRKRVLQIKQAGDDHSSSSSAKMIYHSQESDPCAMRPLLGGTHELVETSVVGLPLQRQHRLLLSRLAGMLNVSGTLEYVHGTSMS